MTNKAHENRKNEPSTDVDQKEGELKWKTKRTVHLSVDFQKIENSPDTELQHEVLQKLANQPSPSEILIKEENRETLRRALNYCKLTKRERACVTLTAQGMRPIHIAAKLGIPDNVVRKVMVRAVQKLRAYVKEEESKNIF